MAEVKLETQNRNIFGKKNNSLRKSGIIPINMYGLGESISLQVEEDILYKTLKEVGFTSPLKISVEGKDETYTLVRNISTHPVTDKLIHVDFLRVDMEKAIEVQVPVSLVNQEDAPGTRGGAGVVTQGTYTFTVTATDGGNLSTQQTFTLEVAKSNDVEAVPEKLKINKKNIEKKVKNKTVVFKERSVVEVPNLEVTKN